MCNVLVGTCIADALGMPFEGMSRDNPLLVNWDGVSFLPSKRHKLKAGMFTDDGQLSVVVAESLIASHGFNPDYLAQRYQNWFFSGSARGFGRTTRMAMNALKDGVHWSESGVEGSYGNGTAMRAAPFGVFFRNDLKALVHIMKIDSAMTHRSEDAEAGAIAIALAAAYAANNDTDDLINKIFPNLPDSTIKRTISTLDLLISSDYIPSEKALKVLGTSANIKETVPAALYCFIKFDNYIDAVQAAIRAGGDADTTAAIVGALSGAQYGLKGIDKRFYSVEDFDKLLGLDSKLFNRTDHAFFPRG